MKYNKPQSEQIITSSLCQYGCNTIAKYRFGNGKLCCSEHYNSCIGKKSEFSKLDHSERTAKSLKTRTENGITKTSQIKGAKTRKESGHYEKLAKKMQEHWIEHPWQNTHKCPLLNYKNSSVTYQGSHEFEFLEMLEQKNGFSWITENVVRGPTFWYNDPVTNTERLYISDFIINGTIYEIKSYWTWNKKGSDKDLDLKNKAKLKAAITSGYNTILILDGNEINASTMD